MDTSIDQDAVNLAKAIRQKESGGNVNAKGQSGEISAYQFTPDTWNSVAPKYGVNTPLEKASLEEQNAVAYNRIKAWKDSGKDVTQIASMWNAGEEEPDAYTGKFGSTTPTHNAGDPSKGVNKFGATYDVPGYVKDVAQNYADLKNVNSQGDTSIYDTSITGLEKKPEKPSIPLAPGENQPIPGVMEQANKGDYLGAISSGIRKVGSFLTGGGTETLGNTIGTLGGYITSPNKEQYDISAPSVGETALGALKTIGSAYGIESAGGIASGLLSKGSVLANPIVTEALGGEQLASKLTNVEKLDQLTSSLSKASASEKLILNKAIEEVGPQAAKELGIAPSLISKAVAKGGGFLATLIKLALQGAGFAVLEKAMGSKPTAIVKGAYNAIPK